MIPTWLKQCSSVTVLILVVVVQAYRNYHAYQ